MTKFLYVWKNYSFIVFIAFVVVGLFDPRFAIAAIVCMVAPIAFSLFKGRFWCGNLCPRGSFYDRVVSKFSNKKKVPKFLKSNIFRTFMVIFMLSMFAIGIYQNRGNLSGIGMVFYRMIVITSMIGIVLALFYNHRTWCHFCPMGTIASVISKKSKGRKLLQIATSCVSCKICETKCPMGIIPYDYKGNSLSHPDCIQCGKCVQVCPKKVIGYSK